MKWQNPTPQTAQGMRGPEPTGPSSHHRLGSPLQHKPPDQTGRLSFEGAASVSSKVAAQAQSCCRALLLSCVKRVCGRVRASHICAPGSYLAGAVSAEITSAFIRVPMQVIKVRLQVDTYSSFFKGLRPSPGGGAVCTAVGTGWQQQSLGTVERSRGVLLTEWPNKMGQGQILWARSLSALIKSSLAECRAALQMLSYAL